jgi:hypothetical protein
MNKNILFITCLLLAFSFLPANSQRNKGRKAKKEVIVEDPKFVAMLEATAKVLIIDSVVVDSTRYLDAIIPNSEEGRITKYSNFFKGEGEGIVYLNQLENKCIYSKVDESTGSKMLYQSDLLADGWTDGELLKGIDDNNQLYDFDFPYLMPDGVTLYFSAKGGDGLGGYDIYRTRFDIESGRYLRPENIGLPFNSKFDDYMLVIDEQNQLAYFATNRKQPQGKVCVYSFLPFETRTIVKGSDEKIRSLANIDRIADTWGNGRERWAALSRKAQIEQKATNERTKINDTKFSFVINDHTTYTKISDFRKPANQTRIKQLLSLQQQLEVLQSALNKSRNYYATASSLERSQLKSEILESEQKIETIKQQIYQIEKNIRITENN